MKQEKIDRISELTRISRQRELTPQEQAERKALREEYIAAIRMSLEGHLDNTYLMDDEGNEVKLKKKED